MSLTLHPFATKIDTTSPSIPTARLFDTSISQFLNFQCDDKLHCYSTTFMSTQRNSLYCQLAPYMVQRLSISMVDKGDVEVE